MATALDFAQANGLEVAVRGGGHNPAGHCVCDGGLVIDLTAMRRVEVDAGASLARAEGGATWLDFDSATQAFGLVTPGGIVGSTGVAGLTLGGGIGHLTAQFGLTCDNLLAAELVTPGRLHGSGEPDRRRRAALGRPRRRRQLRRRHAPGVSPASTRARPRRSPDLPRRRGRRGAAPLPRPRGGRPARPQLPGTAGARRGSRADPGRHALVHGPGRGAGLAAGAAFAAGPDRRRGARAFVRQPAAPVQSPLRPGARLLEGPFRPRASRRTARRPPGADGRPRTPARASC